MWKVMDHFRYPEGLKLKSDAELAFIIKDAQAALDAMPDSRNAGYYADEISYAAMELKSRRQNKDGKR